MHGPAWWLGDPTRRDSSREREDAKLNAGDAENEQQATAGATEGPFELFRAQGATAAAASETTRTTGTDRNLSLATALETLRLGMFT